MNKSKKIMIVIIVLLIILTILLVLTAFLYKKQSQNRSFNKIKADTYKEMKQEMVMPNGIFQLKKNYSGDNDLKDFYRSIFNYSRGIISLSQKNEEDLEKYYDKNKTEIKSEIGTKTIEEYKQLWNYVQKVGKLKNLNTATINTDSLKNTKKYLEFYITFNFDENKELKFYVQLNNRKVTPIAIYKIVDE